MNRAFLFSFLIAIIILQGCTEFDDSDTNNYFADNNYETLCFPDNAGKGIYIIDNRIMFKYMMYRYDFENNIWAYISDGTGLPIGKHNGTLNFTKAFELKNNKIIAFCLNGTIYEFTTLNNWKKVGKTPEELLSYSDNIRFNKYNDKIYLATHNKLFILDENYSWLPSADILYPLQYLGFISADTLLYFEYFNYNSPTTIVKLDILHNKSMISERIFNNITNIPTNYLFVTKDNISFTINNNTDFPSDYSSEYDSLLHFFEIDLNTFNYKTYTPFYESNDLMQNPLDFPRPKKIYQWYNYTPLYPYTFISFIDNNFYLFFEDVGYVYTENKKRWKKLPYLDYKNLNIK